ncbi:MAG: helix-turn-helix domain-containing protein [Armatimonadetes bacterium]|nr:helix-turn-helix domain-containing protein [Armatimonadota bacterium]
MDIVRYTLSMPNRRQFGSTEAAAELGVSRSTLLRWFREGRVSQVRRDRRGWRSFTTEDLLRIRRELGDEVEIPESDEEQDRRGRMRTYLRRVPTFRTLPEPVLDELARCARFHGLLAGQSLFVPGDRARGLHILVKGKVRLFRTSPDGREQVLALAKPYQTVGEAVLFHPAERHVSYAACIESSTVMILPLARVRQLTQQHPQLAFAFLREFARRIEDLEQRLEELALLSLEQRLARILLEWASLGETGEELEMPLTLSELASLLGGARESVSRSFVRLERDGLLRRSGRKVLLLDREGLGRL